MTSYYTVSLKDYPELMLCHNSNPCGTHEFNDPTVAKVVKFNSMERAHVCTQLEFPGLPSGLFTYERHTDCKWEVMYILPKSEYCVVVDRVKYVLQNDGSLTPCGDSTDSRKFNSYKDAYIHMKELGILMGCFVIAATTDDF
jgi:hypothetical protein